MRPAHGGPPQPSRPVFHLDVPRATAHRIIGKPVLLDWITALGGTPELCRAFTVYADGDGLVEFEDHTDPPHAIDDELVVVRYLVPLTVPIPAEVWAAGRR